jgi:NAD(P)-dependent dehydrogenase (short-subunit alcohol dehydrogenase family)
MTARVVVLGGNGNFGARICRALSGDAGIEVVAAGRRSRDAKLDIDSREFPAELKKLAPGIVIHCVGPFQGQDYRVAAAALEAGAHYIDLADGRAFVAGFAQAMDAGARAAGRLAVSGASTLPALSSAVIDSLAGRFRSIEEIQISIAPGQKAPRGAATIAAVFSYAGRPFKRLIGGVWSNAWGWQELRRLRFAGAGTRLAAACDVPDLELFPARYPGVQTVEFRAALELTVQHLAIWLAAGLRRWGVPLPLERWAGALDRVARLLDPFGTDCGGMLVQLTGTRTDGSRGRVEWHLTAEANHGPEIPCMAAILIARRLAAGKIEARGAFPCVGFLGLADFGPEFARWRITTTLEEWVA